MYIEVPYSIFQFRRDLKFSVIWSLRTKKSCYKTCCLKQFSSSISKTKEKATISICLGNRIRKTNSDPGGKRS